jgi:hypothetical protein
MILNYDGIRIDMVRQIFCLNDWMYLHFVGGVDQINVPFTNVWTPVNFPSKKNFKLSVVIFRMWFYSIMLVGIISISIVF